MQITALLFFLLLHGSLVRSVPLPQLDVVALPGALLTTGDLVAQDGTPLSLVEAGANGIGLGIQSETPTEALSDSLALLMRAPVPVGASITVQCAADAADAAVLGASDPVTFTSTANPAQGSLTEFDLTRADVAPVRLPFPAPAGGAGCRSGQACSQAGSTIAAACAIVSTTAPALSPSSAAFSIQVLPRVPPSMGSASVTCQATPETAAEAGVTGIARVGVAAGALQVVIAPSVDAIDATTGEAFPAGVTALTPQDRVQLVEGQAYPPGFLLVSLSGTPPEDVTVTCQLDRLLRAVVADSDDPADYTKRFSPSEATAPRGITFGPVNSIAHPQEVALTCLAANDAGRVLARGETTVVATPLTVVLVAGSAAEDAQGAPVPENTVLSGSDRKVVRVTEGLPDAPGATLAVRLNGNPFQDVTVQCQVVDSTLVRLATATALVRANSGLSRVPLSLGTPGAVRESQEVSIKCSPAARQDFPDNGVDPEMPTGENAAFATVLVEAVRIEILAGSNAFDEDGARLEPDTLLSDVPGQPYPRRIEGVEDKVGETLRLRLNVTPSQPVVVQCASSAPDLIPDLPDADNRWTLSGTSPVGIRIGTVALTVDNETDVEISCSATAAAGGLEPGNIAPGDVARVTIDATPLSIELLAGSDARDSEGALVDSDTIVSVRPSEEPAVKLARAEGEPDDAGKTIRMRLNANPPKAVTVACSSGSPLVLPDCSGSAFDIVHRLGSNGLVASDGLTAYGPGDVIGPGVIDPAQLDSARGITLPVGAFLGSAVVEIRAPSATSGDSVQCRSDDQAKWALDALCGPFAGDGTPASCDFGLQRVRPAAAGTIFTVTCSGVSSSSLTTLPALLGQSVRFSVRVPATSTRSPGFFLRNARDEGFGLESGDGAPYGNGDRIGTGATAARGQGVRLAVGSYLSPCNFDASGSPVICGIEVVSLVGAQLADRVVCYSDDSSKHVMSPPLAEAPDESGSKVIGRKLGQTADIKEQCDAFVTNSDGVAVSRCDLATYSERVKAAAAGTTYTITCYASPLLDGQPRSLRFGAAYRFTVHVPTTSRATALAFQMENVTDNWGLEGFGLEITNLNAGDPVQRIKMAVGSTIPAGQIQATANATPNAGDRVICTSDDQEKWPLDGSATRGACTAFTATASTQPCDFSGARIQPSTSGGAIIVTCRVVHIAGSPRALPGGATWSFLVEVVSFSESSDFHLEATSSSSPLINDTGSGLSFYTSGASITSLYLPLGASVPSGALQAVLTSQGTLGVGGDEISCISENQDVFPLDGTRGRGLCEPDTGTTAPCDWSQAVAQRPPLDPFESRFVVDVVCAGSRVIGQSTTFFVDFSNSQAFVLSVIILPATSTGFEIGNVTGASGVRAGDSTWYAANAIIPDEFNSPNGILLPVGGSIDDGGIFVDPDEESTPTDSDRVICISDDQSLWPLDGTEGKGACDPHTTTNPLCDFSGARIAVAAGKNSQWTQLIPEAALTMTCYAIPLLGTSGPPGYKPGAAKKINVYVPPIVTDNPGFEVIAGTDAGVKSSDESLYALGDRIGSGNFTGEQIGLAVAVGGTLQPADISVRLTGDPVVTRRDRIVCLSSDIDMYPLDGTVGKGQCDVLESTTTVASCDFSEAMVQSSAAGKSIEIVCSATFVLGSLPSLPLGAAYIFRIFVPATDTNPSTPRFQMRNATAGTGLRSGNGTAYNANSAVGTSATAGNTSGLQLYVGSTIAAGQITAGPLETIQGWAVKCFSDEPEKWPLDSTAGKGECQAFGGSIAPVACDFSSASIQPAALNSSFSVTCYAVYSSGAADRDGFLGDAYRFYVFVPRGNPADGSGFQVMPTDLPGFTTGLLDSTGQPYYYLPYGYGIGTASTVSEGNGIRAPVGSLIGDVSYPAVQVKPTAAVVSSGDRIACVSSNPNRWDLDGSVSKGSCDLFETDDYDGLPVSSCYFDNAIINSNAASTNFEVVCYATSSQGETITQSPLAFGAASLLPLGVGYQFTVFVPATITTLDEFSVRVGSVSTLLSSSGSQYSTGSIIGSQSTVSNLDGLKLYVGSTLPAGALEVQDNTDFGSSSDVVACISDDRTRWDLDGTGSKGRCTPSGQEPVFWSCDTSEAVVKPSAAGTTFTVTCHASSDDYNSYFEVGSAYRFTVHVPAADTTAPTFKMISGPGAVLPRRADGVRYSADEEISKGLRLNVGDTLPLNSIVAKGTVQTDVRVVCYSKDQSKYALDGTAGKGQCGDFTSETQQCGWEDVRVLPAAAGTTFTVTCELVSLVRDTGQEAVDITVEVPALAVQVADCERTFLPDNGTSPQDIRLSSVAFSPDAEAEVGFVCRLKSAVAGSGLTVAEDDQAHVTIVAKPLEVQIVGGSGAVDNADGSSLAGNQLAPLLAGSPVVKLRRIESDADTKGKTIGVRLSGAPGGPVTLLCASDNEDLLGYPGDVDGTFQVIPQGNVSSSDGTPLGGAPIGLSETVGPRDGLSLPVGSSVSSIIGLTFGAVTDAVVCLSDDRDKWDMVFCFPDGTCGNNLAPKTNIVQPAAAGTSFSVTCHRRSYPPESLRFFVHVPPVAIAQTGSETFFLSTLNTDGGLRSSDGTAYSAGSLVGTGTSVATETGLMMTVGTSVQPGSLQATTSESATGLVTCISDAPDKWPLDGTPTKGSCVTDGAPMCDWSGAVVHPSAAGSSFTITCYAVDRLSGLWKADANAIQFLVVVPATDVASPGFQMESVLKSYGLLRGDGVAYGDGEAVTSGIRVTVGDTLFKSSTGATPLRAASVGITPGPGDAVACVSSDQSRWALDGTPGKGYCGGLSLTPYCDFSEALVQPSAAGSNFSIVCYAVGVPGSKAELAPGAAVRVTVSVPSVSTLQPGFAVIADDPNAALRAGDGTTYVRNATVGNGTIQSASNGIRASVGDVLGPLSIRPSIGLPTTSDRVSCMSEYRKMFAADGTPGHGECIVSASADRLTCDFSGIFITAAAANSSFRMSCYAGSTGGPAASLAVGRRYQFTIWVDAVTVGSPGFRMAASQSEAIRASDSTFYVPNQTIGTRTSTSSTSGLLLPVGSTVAPAPGSSNLPISAVGDYYTLPGDRVRCISDDLDKWPLDGSPTKGECAPFEEVIGSPACDFSGALVQPSAAGTTFTVTCYGTYDPGKQRTLSPGRALRITVVVPETVPNAGASMVVFTKESGPSTQGITLGAFSPILTEAVEVNVSCRVVAATSASGFSTSDEATVPVVGVPLRLSVLAGLKTRTKDGLLNPLTPILPDVPIVIVEQQKDEESRRIAITLGAEILGGVGTSIDCRSSNSLLDSFSVGITGSLYVPVLLPTTVNISAIVSVAYTCTVVDDGIPGLAAGETLTFRVDVEPLRVVILAGASAISHATRDPLDPLTLLSGDAPTAVRVVSGQKDSAGRTLQVGLNGVPSEDVTVKCMSDALEDPLLVELTTAVWSAVSITLPTLLAVDQEQEFTFTCVPDEPPENSGLSGTADEAGSVEVVVVPIGVRLRAGTGPPLALSGISFVPGRLFGPADVILQSHFAPDTPAGSSLTVSLEGAPLAPLMIQCRSDNTGVLADSDEESYMVSLGTSYVPGTALPVGLGFTHGGPADGDLVLLLAATNEIWIPHNRDLVRNQDKIKVSSNAVAPLLLRNGSYGPPLPAGSLVSCTAYADVDQAILLGIDPFLVPGGASHSFEFSLEEPVAPQEATREAVEVKFATVATTTYAYMRCTVENLPQSGAATAWLGVKTTFLMEIVPEIFVVAGAASYSSTVSKSQIAPETGLSGREGILQDNGCIVPLIYSGVRYPKGQVAALAFGRIVTSATIVCESDTQLIANFPVPVTASTLRRDLDIPVAATPSLTDELTSITCTVLESPSPVNISAEAYATFYVLVVPRPATLVAGSAGATRAFDSVRLSPGALVRLPPLRDSEPTVILLEEGVPACCSLAVKLEMLPDTLVEFTCTVDSNTVSMDSAVRVQSTDPVDVPIPAFSGIGEPTELTVSCIPAYLASGYDPASAAHKLEAMVLVQPARLEIVVTDDATDANGDAIPIGRVISEGLQDVSPPPTLVLYEGATFNTKALGVRSSGGQSVAGTVVCESKGTSLPTFEVDVVLSGATTADLPLPLAPPRDNELLARYECVLEGGQDLGDLKASFLVEVRPVRLYAIAGSAGATITRSAQSMAVTSLPPATEVPSGWSVVLREGQSATRTMLSLALDVVPEGLSSATTTCTSTSASLALEEDVSGSLMPLPVLLPEPGTVSAPESLFITCTMAFESGVGKTARVGIVVAATRVIVEAAVELPLASGVETIPAGSVLTDSLERAPVVLSGQPITSEPLQLRLSAEAGTTIVVTCTSDSPDVVDTVPMVPLSGNEPSALTLRQVGYVSETTFVRLSCSPDEDAGTMETTDETPFVIRVEPLRFMMQAGASARTVAGATIPRGTPLKPGDDARTPVVTQATADTTSVQLAVSGPPPANAVILCRSANPLVISTFSTVVEQGRTGAGPLRVPASTEVEEPTVVHFACFSVSQVGGFDPAVVFEFEVVLMPRTVEVLVSDSATDVRNALGEVLSGGTVLSAGGGLSRTIQVYSGVTYATGTTVALRPTVAPKPAVIFRCLSSDPEVMPDITTIRIVSADPANVALPAPAPVEKTTTVEYACRPVLPTGGFTANAEAFFSVAVSSADVEIVVGPSSDGFSTLAGTPAVEGATLVGTGVASRTLVLVEGQLPPSDLLRMRPVATPDDPIKYRCFSSNPDALPDLEEVELATQEGSDLPLPRPEDLTTAVTITLSCRAVGAQLPEPTPVDTSIAIPDPGSGTPAASDTATPPPLLPTQAPGDTLPPPTPVSTLESPPPTLDPTPAPSLPPIQASSMRQQRVSSILP